MLRKHDSRDESLSFSPPCAWVFTWCLCECVDWVLNGQCLKRTLTQFIEWFNSSWVRHTNCMIISQNFGIWVASITWRAAVTIPKWCLPPHSWFISRCKQTKIWPLAGWDYPGCINQHIYNLSLQSEKVMVCAAPQRGGIAVPVQDFCRMREARWSRPPVLRTLFRGIKTTFDSK